MTSQPRPGSGGLRALGEEEFSVAAAVGGWRGMIESVAPGLVFVVTFVIARDVTLSVVASLAVALIAVVARLVRRSSVTYALGGVLGVVIGAIWAWRSGEAENYYLWGLLTNAGFALLMLITLLVRYPLVGLVAGALGLSRREHTPRLAAEREARVQREVAELAAEGVSVTAEQVREAEAVEPTVREALADAVDLSWRSEPGLLRRYTLATWLWFAAFLLRLAVQVPLYLGGSVGWLGTARLVMGLPLWALVLWFTWLLIRPQADAAAPEQPGRSSR